MKYKVGDYGSYVFDASAQTITFSNMLIGEYEPMTIDMVLTVINVVDGEIIYRFEDSTKGGTMSLSGNILTLDYDTTSMSDNDELIIYVDTPTFESFYDSTCYYHTIEEIVERGGTSRIDLHSKVSSESMPMIANPPVTALAYDGDNEGGLQIFRASTDNIHDIFFAAQAVGEAGITETLLFDCEYASDAAAQEDWTSSNNSDWAVRYDSSPRYAGSYSLRLDVNSSNAYNDTITHTFSETQDWSDVISFDFRKYCSQSAGQLTLEIVDDSDNEMTYTINYSSSNTWYLEEVTLSDMTGYSSVDLENIEIIRWVCINTYNYPQYYLDSIEISETDLTTISIPCEIELYDFGTNGTPTTLGTPMTLDEGETSTTVNVSGRARVYNAHVHKGSHVHTAANKLTIGNYYGLYCKRPATGTIYLIGSATTQVYQSGKFYTVDDGSLTAVDDASLGFCVFSCLPGVVRSVRTVVGDAPESNIYLFVTDNYGKMLRLVVSKNFHEGETEVTYTFSSKRPDILYTNEERNLNIVYTDSFISEAEKTEVEVEFAYKSFPIYG